jgi:hypothetical protein
MAGTGCFPPQLRAATPDEQRYDLAEIDTFLQRSMLNFPPHRDALRDSTVADRQRTLQVYFW